MDYFAVLRTILITQTTPEQIALFAIARFNIIEGRLDAAWPLTEPAIVVDMYGGDEAGGTRGKVIHPTLDIWCYGAGGKQPESKALEAALSEVLNGALLIETSYGTLMSATRERPASGEYDPDMKRAFQRATYRTRFKGS